MKQTNHLHDDIVFIQNLENKLKKNNQKQKTKKNENAIIKVCHFLFFKRVQYVINTSKKNE